MQCSMSLFLTMSDDRTLVWILLHEKREGEEILSYDMLRTTIENTEFESDELAPGWATRRLLTVVREIRYNEQSIITSLPLARAAEMERRAAQNIAEVLPSV